MIKVERDVYSNLSMKAVDDINLSWRLSVRCSLPSPRSCYNLFL